MKYLILISFIQLVHVAQATTFESELVSAAHARTLHQVRYDGRYISIKYPNGDVPAHIGVCTDVIIRAYRVLGVDLQKLRQKLWRLFKQLKQLSHAMFGSTATRSPGLNRVTPLPVFSTIPENS